MDHQNCLIYSAIAKTENKNFHKIQAKDEITDTVHWYISNKKQHPKIEFRAVINCSCCFLRGKTKMVFVVNRSLYIAMS